MVREPKPNIVIFLMDCVRPDHMSCYGYPKKTTPNIDAVRKEGVLFRNAITTSGWTLPTHASLFTGLYPSLHGAHREHLYLDDKYPTMAQILKEEGYETAGFSSVGYVSRKTGLDRGFANFYESFHKDGLRNQLDSYTMRYKIIRFFSLFFERIRRDTIPGRIVNWKVKNWFRNRKRSKPFFLFVHYIDAHKPYRFNSYYNRLFISNEKKLNLSKDISDYNWPQLTLNLHRIDKETLLSLYDSKLFAVDYCISEIIGYLKEQCLYDNTVLFFLSDHGERVIGGFDHHFFLDDEVLRIPLIVRWPEDFNPGTEREDLVSIVDLLPTILDMLGLRDAEIRAPLQGYSLLDPCKGNRYVIAERGRMNDPWFNKFSELKTMNCLPPTDCVRKAVRTKRFKYIWSSDGEFELYDLASDPVEKVNLINDLPIVATELEDLLFEAVKTEEIRIDQKKSAEIEGELRKSLEGLGYL